MCSWIYFTEEKTTDAIGLKWDILEKNIIKIFRICDL